MTTMFNWQKFTQHFSMKISLPHLLIGVIAAAFSFSDQSSLNNRSHETDIITIASVMVNLHEYQSDKDVQSLSSCINKNSKSFVQLKSTFISYDNFSPTILRLTPNNGIRAGPDLLWS